MKKEILNEMFGNLLHIGNKTNYWNSKMKNYIHSSVNWVHVINLVKTAEKLEEVKAELKALASEGKKILFVATKLQARDAFEKLATDTGHYFVTEKWVPGLLTNFKTIKARISTYLKLKKDLETGEFSVLTKKEKAAKWLELEKLEKSYRWVKEMKKVPEILFVVDWIYEKQSIKEANNLWLYVYSIFNTNGDDTIVTNMIPANTNSVKSINYLATSLEEALKWITVSKKNVAVTEEVKRTPVNKTIVKKTDANVENVEVKKEEGKEVKATKPKIVVNKTIKKEVKKTEAK